MQQQTSPFSKCDVKAWLSGLAAGNLAGIEGIVAKSNNPKWNIISMVFGVCLGLLIGPAVTSAVARRRPFVWGFLPALVYYVYYAYAMIWGISQATQAVHNNPKLLPPVVHGVPTASISLASVLPPLLGFSFLLLLLCVSLASGPVALARHLSVQRKEAEATARALQQKSASIPQEGVWPPPPTQ